MKLWRVGIVIWNRSKRFNYQTQCGCVPELCQGWLPWQYVIHSILCDAVCRLVLLNIRTLGQLSRRLQGRKGSLQGSIEAYRWIMPKRYRTSLSTCHYTMLSKWSWLNKRGMRTQYLLLNCIYNVTSTWFVARLLIFNSSHMARLLIFLAWCRESIATKPPSSPVCVS